MLQKIKNTVRNIVVLFNILTILAMIFTGFGGYANPVSHNYIAVSTLAFPIFLILNVAFSVFWMIFKFRLVLIPLTGFIICYQPIRLYCPINQSEEPPTDALKFVSYNICNFREYDYPEGEKNPTITFLEECGADIICLQEAMHGDRIKKLMSNRLDYIYPYQDFSSRTGNKVAILSKHPIISGMDIDYVSDTNLSKAWKVKIEGDTVLVINNHLESNKLSPTDRDKFKRLVKDNVKDKDAREDSKLLVSKLATAAEIRAAQADSIAKYIEENSNISIIACGDFNDTPLSYARRKISENLYDCYVEKGCGPGISYHTGGFYVRIDNVLCSSDWKIYKCEIDNKTAASDHYPICSWIKKRYKTMKKNNKTL